jgi:inositol 2-dehydrogenase
VRSLRIGLIGVGEMGRRHADNLRFAIPGATLAALADVDRDRARRAAGELGLSRWFDNAEELIAESDVDAVVISSPPKFHAATIIAAASAGKHIFCEKPLALTLPDADAALQAVHAAGVVLQVGHMRRYDPAYLEAKARIEAGEIGDIVIFKSIGRDPFTPPSAAAQTDINGTLFHDSSTHDFDLARWLTGDEVIEVHAFTGAIAMPEMQRYGGFDSGVVNLRFQSGAIGNVESFLDARYGYDVRTEIVGAKGALQVGQLRQTALVALTQCGATHDLIGHWLVRFEQAYQRELEDFVECVAADRTPRVTGHDGRMSLAIALAALESARSRRAVALGSGQRAGA